jgi:uncharacterized Fe-S cluster protein YjdI
MSEDVYKEYTNGEVTVVWQSIKCIHSRVCCTGLPEVFDPMKRPWINVHAASTEKIKKQVDLCPTGALCWYENK